MSPTPEFTRGTRQVLSALLLALTGCTDWGRARPLDAVPMPVQERDRYEIWTSGEAYQLHALRIDGDTLRGVPYWNSPTCDSCRVAIPRMSVDSVRVRTYDGGRTGGLALLVTFLFLPLFIFGIPAGD